MASSPPSLQTLDVIAGVVEFWSTETDLVKMNQRYTLTNEG